MLSVSSLIEFLMNLLRDEEAQAEFERDPQGMLARHGLDNVCGQDVRDVAPAVADQPGVHAKDDAHGARTYDQTGNGTGSYQQSDDDPVREISYMKNNYEVDRSVTHNEYTLNYHDDRTTVNIDDRDTVNIDSDGGDVTIDDSFNSDNSVTIVEDSFNEDNDGIDNKGGTIDDSVAAGDDIDESFNSDDDTTVSDSGNDDSDNSTTVSDSGNDSSDNSTTVADSDNDYSETTEDSYNDNSTDTEDSYDEESTDAETAA